MIGAFVALEIGRLAQLPLPVVMVLCAVVGGVLGALEEILAVRRLYGKNSHNELVTTLGASTILSGLALVIFGSDPQSLSYVDDSTFDLLGGRIAMADILIILAAILLAGIVALVTRKTMVGLSSLATSEDREAATLRGINVKGLALGAFAVAGAAVAAAGPLVAQKTYATYNLGDSLAVKAFVALAIGGFGSQLGAVIGGFGVGFLETFAARYIGSEWRNIAVFVVLLIIMMVRPQGIFGRRVERAV
jgi:branched-chain amino acid transport system permease protein